MPNPCVKSLKVLTDFDYLDSQGRSLGMQALEDYVRDVAYISAIYHGEDDSVSGSRIISATGSDIHVRRLLARISGMSEDEAGKWAANNNDDLWRKVLLDANPEERRLAVKSIDAYLKALYASIQNPDKLLSLSLDCCRTKSILNQQSMAMKYSNKLTAMLKKFTGALGIKYTIYENKINALQFYPPARSLYRMINEINNFTEGHGKLLINETHKIIRQAARKDIFKQQHIGASELSQMMEFFNKNSNPGADGKHREFFSWADSKKILPDDGTYDSPSGQALYNEIHNIAKQWWRINYGDEGLASDPALANERVNNRWTYKHGIVGYYNELRNKISDVYDKYAEIARSTGTEIDPLVKEFMDTISGYKFRHHYISMSRDDEILSAFDNVSDEWRLKFPDYMSHTRDVDEDAQNIDFLKNVDDNILETNMLFNKMSNKITALALKAQLDSEGSSGQDWFKANDRHDIRISVQSLIDDLNLKADFRSAQQGIAVRSIKTIGNALQTFIASYLFFPGSAFNNYLGGTVQLKMRLGTAVEKADFKHALTDPNHQFSDVAHMVDEYANKWLVSTGMPMEFLRSGQESGVGDLIDKANDIIGRAGDFMAKGLFGKFSNGWKNYCSLDGTERILREAIKPYLYNMMVSTASIASNGKILPTDKAELKEFYTKLMEDNVDNAWYEITNALGLFNGVNKGFYLHTLNDTATTVPGAMAGMALKVWNTFRSVATYGFDNYVKSGIDFGYELGREGFNASATTYGAAGFGAIALSVLSLVMTMLKNEHSIVFSPLQAIGPINEPVAALKAIGVQAACLMGANISDANYQLVKEDAIGYFMGALGGRYLADKWTREAQNRLSFGNDPITTTIDVIANGEIAGNLKHGINASTSLYKARARLRDSWSPLMMSDPIYLAERLVELGFIKGGDISANKKFFVDTAKNTLASMTGLSIYAMPENATRRYRNYDKDTDWDRGLIYLKGHNKPYMRHFYSNDITDRIERTAFKYGYISKPKGQP